MLYSCNLITKLEVFYRILQIYPVNTQRKNNVVSPAMQRCKVSSASNSAVTAWMQCSNVASTLKRRLFNVLSTCL